MMSRYPKIIVANNVYYPFFIFEYTVLIYMIQSIFLAELQ